MRSWHMTGADICYHGRPDGCVSSTYWNNPDYPNCARLLKQHHKIVSDAKVKADEMRAIEYGDDVEVPIREHS